MGMQVGNNKRGVMAEMNVVPLIDVLLVLLIIFMAIAPTISMGLKAVVPQPGPAGDERNPIVVQVFADGGLKINGEQSSWDTLGSRMQSIFQLRAEKVAFVKGDAKVNFSEVARAIDAIRTAGVEHVGLLTERM
jgi:biopolymer transport protein TolR